MALAPGLSDVVVGTPIFRGRLARSTPASKAQIEEEVSTTNNTSAIVLAILEVADAGASSITRTLGLNASCKRTKQFF